MGVAESGGKKDDAENDLEVTTKEVNTDVDIIEGTRKVCPEKAQENEAVVKSKEEELRALAVAKWIISEGELWNAITETEMLKERVPLHVQELVGKNLRRRRAQLKEVAVPAATLDDLVHRRQGWVSPFLFVAVMERNRKHCNGELREVSVAHGG